MARTILLILSFRIDSFVPGSDDVGGYSMCSCPTMYKTHGTFDLAIKHSEHPAAQWMHQKVYDIAFQMNSKLFLRLIPRVFCITM